QHDRAKEPDEEVEPPCRVEQRPQQVAVDARMGRVAHWRLRYVTFGFVPTSSRSLLPRGDRARRETSLSGSSRSPNTTARAGHAWAQAVLMSPSLSSRSSA